MESFIVSVKYDDSLYNVYSWCGNRVIGFINRLDLGYIEDYHIYYIKDFGFPPIEIFYCGWQPNGRIELADAEGNVVLAGYGEDH